VSALRQFLDNSYATRRSEIVAHNKEAARNRALGWPTLATMVIIRRKKRGGSDSESDEDDDDIEVTIECLDVTSEYPLAFKPYDTAA
jgi:hypothetical protein